METVIIVIHLMIVAALVTLILLQKSEGGALGIGGGGGGGNFMSGRGTANVLTRATTLLAAGFFATSIILTILANRGDSGSILDAGTPGAPGVQVPAVPGGATTTEELMEQLQPGSGGGTDDSGESGPQVPISQ